MKRIAIIGNAGGGKSTFARKLGQTLNVPVHEIDQLQWKPDWTRAAPDEFNPVHDRWLAAPEWVIDGWGSWEAITRRFDLADTIVFVDYTLVRHYWWAIKRHAKAVLGLNPDWPPPGCRALPITGRLLKLMWTIHWTMRPQLLELAMRYRDRKQVAHIRSPRQFEDFLRTADGSPPQ